MIDSTEIDSRGDAVSIPSKSSNEVGGNVVVPAPEEFRGIKVMERFPGRAPEGAAAVRGETRRDAELPESGREIEGVNGAQGVIAFPPDRLELRTCPNGVEAAGVSTPAENAVIVISEPGPSKIALTPDSVRSNHARVGGLFRGEAAQMFEGGGVIHFLQAFEVRPGPAEVSRASANTHGPGERGDVVDRPMFDVDGVLTPLPDDSVLAHRGANGRKRDQE